ncbi:6-phosphofructokinase [Acuticoccus sp. MNP-M23]|uniref:6-phosphofructokinase n=1 Tax=Acuticoccus sp. MNP-M23 TaxID=3072793 RepID=UPI002814B534|nr:6-phosphofructokinase [Acuticoccus sp. MNP-M23]WMS43571.1 6-phosphofructokinase [Acuticoccus sp. MNP-M23]
MRLAILTSGGDSPGMNAAVWRLDRAAAARGWTALGIPGGFAGLLARSAAPIDPAMAARFARLGGTWLGTSRLPDLPARLGEIAGAIDALGIGGLVILGGNGSLAGAGRIAEAAGIPVVGIAGTIDNDVAVTDLSLGFDTAVAYGMEAADRLRDTAESLPRFFALETLGGPTGHIAAAVGRLAGAVATLIPEEDADLGKVTDAVGEALAAGDHALVVASEGVASLEATLGTIAEGVATRLRMVRLGHAQRGGSPSVRDRAAAAAYAALAVDAIAEGTSGIAALKAGSLTLATYAEHRDADAPDPRRWRGLL